MAAVWVGEAFIRFPVPLYLTLPYLTPLNPFNYITLHTSRTVHTYIKYNHHLTTFPLFLSLTHESKGTKTQKLKAGSTREKNKTTNTCFFFNLIPKNPMALRSRDRKKSSEIKVGFSDVNVRPTFLFSFSFSLSLSFPFPRESGREWEG